MSPPSLPILTSMMVTLIVPLAILYAGKTLSVKYSAYKKIFGFCLIVMGLLEIVGFFQFHITINDITYIIPQHPKIIMLVQGFMTLLIGLDTFYSKPKPMPALQKIK